MNFLKSVLNACLIKMYTSHLFENPVLNDGNEKERRQVKHIAIIRENR